MIDAYLVEYDDGERAIVDPSDYDYDYTRSAQLGTDAGTIVAALECVRSWDHGARTSEELDLDRCAEGAAWIMEPLLALMLPAPARWHASAAYELAMAHIIAEYGVTRSEHSGLWHCDDPDDAQWLYELWDYTVEPALGDAGYVVETSGDAGMTWVYREARDNSNGGK